MQLPLTRGWQKFVWELKLRVLFFLRNVLVLLLIFSCISVPYERFCIDPLTVYLRYPLDYPELDNIPFDSNFKFLKNKEALTVQHTGRGYSVEGVVPSQVLCYKKKVYLRLLYLSYDKECVKFSTYYFLVFETNLGSVFLYSHKASVIMNQLECVLYLNSFYNIA